MQILGLILILINVGAIVAPIAGMVAVYHNNLQELVIPPEVEQIVGNTITILTQTNLPSSPHNGSNTDNSSDDNLELPVYVNSTVDSLANTVTVDFNFANPFNFTITIYNVSADVRCHAHNFLLGQAAMIRPVEVAPMQSSIITVVLTGSDAAKEHVQTQHAGQPVINVDLANITINVSGISIETPETYNVDIPLS